MMFQIVRRLIYASALAAILITVTLLELRVNRGATDSQTFFLPYVATIQVCIIALLLWCIIFVRSEPLLVRIALGLIGLTLLGCIFIYRL